MKIVSFLLSLFFISCSTPNTKVVESKKTPIASATHLYAGTELPPSELSQVLTEYTESTYMYFISVDGVKINSPSLMNGVKEIFVKPGQHEMQVRFVSKGSLAIPLKAFPSFHFEKGKKYLIQSRIVHGTGNYIQAAKTTEINVWLKDLTSGKEYLHMKLNGFGK